MKRGTNPMDVVLALKRNGIIGMFVHRDYKLISTTKGGYAVVMVQPRTSTPPSHAPTR